MFLVNTGTVVLFEMHKLHLCREKCHWQLNSYIKKLTVRAVYIERWREERSSVFRQSSEINQDEGSPMLHTMQSGLSKPMPTLSFACCGWNLSPLKSAAKFKQTCWIKPA